jgi:hypothetical protein
MADTYLQNEIVIVTDWVGFICLLLTTLVLAYKLMGFRGPADVSEDYFFGSVTFI